MTALTNFTSGSIEQGSIVEQGGSVLHEVEQGGSMLHGVEQGGNVVHGVEQEGRKGLLRDFVCAASTGAVPPWRPSGPLDFASEVDHDLTSSRGMVIVIGKGWNPVWSQ